MFAPRFPLRSSAASFGAALILFATMASACAAASPEDAAIRTSLERSGLLADPAQTASGTIELADMVITQHLQSSEPRLEVTLDSPDASGRPNEATVLITRHVTGSFDIQRPGLMGSDRFVRKAVNDSCVRQVVLHRVANDWRVATVSADVRLTPRGRTLLPLVDLNTHAVSSGHLSLLSDLDELAVHPQTCAVTKPGDSVHVFVSGVDRGSVVTVFANGRMTSAQLDAEGHYLAALKLESGARLQSIGVTVYSRASLYDPAAPADSRTWVLPILVGAPPAANEQYFGGI